MLAWPGLSQIAAHLILIPAPQDDNSLFTEEGTEAPAGGQLGRAHTGCEWPSWDVNAGLGGSKLHQPQPTPLLPNGECFLGQILEIHTGCKEPGGHIASAPVHRPPQSPSNLLASKVDQVQAHVLEAERGKMIELNFRGLLWLPGPVLSPQVWPVPRMHPLTLQE